MPQRSFFIGSEWLYYKLYMGPKMCDSVLTEVILPMVQVFKSKKWISQWFFIRYADPKQHLRIRFQLTEKSALGKIVEEVHQALAPFVERDLIWNIQLDTYHREMERYGTNTMELSETVFYCDSEAVIAFLDLIEGDEGEQLRWLYGLRAVDLLLSVFEYGIDEKLKFMENLKIGFGKEFNMSRPLKKQLDDRFRKERQTIENFMGFTKEEEPEYVPILEVLQQSSSALKPVARKILEMDRKDMLQITKNGLLGSYVHMLMNRLFKSKNRLNEMVCYDFLYRYYKSSIAKQKKMTAPS
nr:thiopeptide-type bacteriocin biosynthesis protein [uncultured Allomuricauda sp.]